MLQALSNFSFDILPMASQVMQMCGLADLHGFWLLVRVEWTTLVVHP